MLLTNSVAMGGMERHVELLARYLDRSVFEVFTVCPSWPPIEIFDQTLRRAADRHWQSTPDRRWGRTRELTEAFALYRYLRTWRIDILHMHLTTFRGGSLVLIAAKAAGVPVILCTEHLAPEKTIGRVHRLRRAAFVSALSRLICVSEKNRIARQTYLWTPSKRTSVVVNGVDVADFPLIDPGVVTALRRGLGLPANAKIAGSVVRLAPDKGLEYLLDAFPTVLANCPSAYLLLVGDGPLREQLAMQARDLCIQERVIFAGFHADPRPYLALMDAFVLPVPVGSMSVGLLEAMAMYRPSVITFGGPGEAVVHEVSGLWSTPRDPKALAEAMIRLLNDPAQARAYGEAAHKRVEESFSATGVAASLGAIYQTLSQRASLGRTRLLG